MIHFIYGALLEVLKDTRSKQMGTQNLEVLQQVSAGDFAAADLLLHQPVGGQEEGHQLGQLPLEVAVDV